tara:strand:- start:438 stop:1034 length:597 start_codon:yes stop_codon:yes gene_type:complete
MLKIIERIKQIINKGKFSDEQKRGTYNEGLLKIDRGRSFKGHEAQLSIDSYNDEDTPRLYLGNKYFAGYVSYSFCNKNQNTVRTVSHDYLLPKWLQQTRLDILARLNYVKNGRSSYHDDILFNVTNNIEIRLSPYGIVIQEKVIEPGLRMYGHRKNIEYLNELKRLGSYFRKWMKEIDTSTMEFSKEDGIVFTGNLFK